MNTLKTVVVTVVFMAIGYGVYVSLWQKPDKNAGDKSPGATSLPLVSIPGQGSPSSPSNSSMSTGTVGRGTSSLPPLARNSSSPAPLFGANPRGTSSSSPNSVTLIPGPNSANPPSDPSIPAPSASILPQPNPVNTMGSTGLSGGAGNTSNTSSMASEQDEFRREYKSFLQDIQKILDEGKLPDALRDLTTVYENPNLPEAERREIEHLLDQLAGTVIYSPQSFLERPYVVQSGDTLDKIAERCSVPALLLARINGIDPQQLQPGQEIKILRGPFAAVISLDKHELMLKLQGGYYAGRFSVGVGTDCPTLEGAYSVIDKTPRPIYRGPDGVNFPADDPRNPFGKHWIGLNDRIGLHGTTDESSVGRNGSRGVLLLKNRDIDDLFGILSIGSQVVIRK